MKDFNGESISKFEFDTSEHASEFMDAASKTHSVIAIREGNAIILAQEPHYETQEVWRRANMFIDGITVKEGALNEFDYAVLRDHGIYKYNPNY